MSTRASIIVKTPETCLGIYCHSDGYPSWLGTALQTHFPTYADALALVSLGDISGIGRCGNVDAYHRDRGEPWEDVSPLTGDTIDEVSQVIETNGHCYAFQDGQWHHNGQPLADVLSQATAATP